jgi:hypothetical protein
MIAQCGEPFRSGREKGSMKRFIICKSGFVTERDGG